MKILQVIPSLAWGFGGPTSEVLGLSFALARLNHEVSVFTTDADVNGRLSVPLEAPVREENVEFVYFPVQYPRHYKFSLPLAKALKKRIPDFDIVHIHSLFQFSTLAASYYCRKYNKPHIIEPIGQLDPYVLRRRALYKSLYLRLFERKNLEGASALHFTTEEERSLTEALSLKAKSIVVGIGLDFAEFKSLPEYGTFRAKYPELKEKKIILFLSRINFKKGLDILTDAFGRLVKERTDVQLVIAGPDNEGYASQVKKWLKERGALNNTTFTGMLLGREKLAAFRDSDVFVLPSYSENFGMVVIEAMASGVPVIISNKVGIYREVQKYNAGIVIDCNEVSLYRAIKSMLDDANFAQDLSSRARKTAEECYDINNVAYKMTEAYGEILRSGKIKDV